MHTIRFALITCADYASKFRYNHFISTCFQIANFLFASFAHFISLHTVECEQNVRTFSEV